MSLISRLLYFINDAVPWAKRLLPKGLHRFALIRWLDVNKDYDAMLRENPERLFLSNEVMPWVAAHCRKVLFVGTSSYTFQYETLFKDDPDRYFTIDKLPSLKVWGSRHHIVGLVEDVHHHVPPDFFDAVVANGLLFYRIPGRDDHGVSGTPAEMEALSLALHRVLKPGGLLVLGWNRKDEPANLCLAAMLGDRFGPASCVPWGTRRTFPGDPHVFESFCRSP